MNHVFTLDRIEGNYAVVLWNEDEVSLPLAWLPQDASEGSSYALSITPSDESEVLAKDVSDALSRLQADSEDLENFEL